MDITLRDRIGKKLCADDARFRDRENACILSFYQIKQAAGVTTKAVAAEREAKVAGLIFL